MNKEPINPEERFIKYLQNATLEEDFKFRLIYLASFFKKFTKLYKEESNSKKIS